MNQDVEASVVKLVMVCEPVHMGSIWFCSHPVDIVSLLMFL